MRKLIAKLTYHMLLTGKRNKCFICTFSVARFPMIWIMNLIDYIQSIVKNFAWIVDSLRQARQFFLYKNITHFKFTIRPCIQFGAIEYLFIRFGTSVFLIFWKNPKIYLHTYRPWNGNDFAYIATTETVFSFEFPRNIFIADILISFIVGHLDLH